MERFFERTGLTWSVIVTLIGLFSAALAGYVTLKVQHKDNTQEIKELENSVGALGPLRHEVHTIRSGVDSIKREIHEDFDQIDTHIQGLNNRDITILERLSAMEANQRRVLNAVEKER